MAFSSVYMQKAQSRENASSTFCGTGWNCTYTIDFIGPGYKCDDVNDTNDTDASFTLADLAPKGNLVYTSDVDQGDYAHQDPGKDGEDLGVF